MVPMKFIRSSSTAPFEGQRTVHNMAHPSIITSSGTPWIRLYCSTWSFVFRTAFDRARIAPLSPNKDLMNHIVDNQTKLVITGKDPTPVQVQTHHEEADVIIIHHLVQISVVTRTSKWSATIQMYLFCLFISTSKKI